MLEANFARIIEDGTLVLGNLADYGVFHVVGPAQVRSDQQGWLNGYNFWSPELYDLKHSMAFGGCRLSKYGVMGIRPDESGESYDLNLRSGPEDQLSLKLLVGHVRLIDPLASGKRRIFRDNFVEPTARRIDNCVIQVDALGRSEIMLLRMAQPFEIRAFDLQTKQMLEVSISRPDIRQSSVDLSNLVITPGLN